jgi:hypothetical protein
MARSRREFLKDGAVGGAALGILGLPAVTIGQTARSEAMPTPQAKALMALFGLRYPIFQGPYGGPVLATAISNAGALGHVALWRRTPEVAHSIVHADPQPN